MKPQTYQAMDGFVRVKWQDSPICPAIVIVGEEMYGLTLAEVEEMRDALTAIATYARHLEACKP